MSFSISILNWKLNGTFSARIFSAHETYVKVKNDTDKLYNKW